MAVRRANHYTKQAVTLFILPNIGQTHPGTYNTNAPGSYACTGSNSLWARTLDTYTRAGLPECVVSTMSGPPSKTRMTEHNDTHPIPGQKIKFLIPPVIKVGPLPGWKAELYRAPHGDVTLS